MTRVRDLLQQARRLGVGRLDANLLVAHCLGVSRAWVLAHDDAEPAADVVAACGAAFARRADGEPLSYIVGEREFHGVRLAVTPAVLDPRPDTETLVDWAIELLSSRPTVAAAIDLGTGSGAIALAVKRRCPLVRMTATDASAAALEVAVGNALRLGLEVEFALGDWWGAAPGRRYDVALSNPPYIAAADAHLPALRHEPLLALTPGRTGLEAIEAIVSGAAAHLVPGGWLLVEHGFDQGAAVRALLAAHAFTAVETRCDLAGQPRCSAGRRAA